MPASSAAGIVISSLVSRKSGEILTMSGLAVAARTARNTSFSSRGPRGPAVDQLGVGRGDVELDQVAELLQARHDPHVVLRGFARRGHDQRHAVRQRGQRGAVGLEARVLEPVAVDQPRALRGLDAHQVGLGMPGPRAGGDALGGDRAPARGPWPDGGSRCRSTSTRGSADSPAAPRPASSRAGDRDCGTSRGDRAAGAAGPTGPSPPRCARAAAPARRGRTRGRGDRGRRPCRGPGA